MQQLIFLMLGTGIILFLLWLITQFLDRESGYGLYMSLVLFGILLVIVTMVLASSIQILIFRN